MTEEAIEKYCRLMEEIRLRTEVIRSFFEGSSHAVYKATTIESSYLQFRKILELIALGSLVANKEIFSKVQADFGKCWNAAYIIKDIERINPDFYPHPIVEMPSVRPGIKMDWNDHPGGFLTQKEFLKLYEKCGAILHADNPFGSQIDYGYYEQNINVWAEKIALLLNCHTIKLVGDENIHLIHMLEEQDRRVHHYIFARK